VDRAGVVVAVLALVVLGASLAPVPGTVSTASTGTVGADKLLHAVAYAGLTFAVATAVDTRSPGRLAGVVLAVTAFGVAVELVQPFVGRTASLLDALADLAGSLAGALSWAVSRSR
jgi:VanZ family protein